MPVLLARRALVAAAAAAVALAASASVTSAAPVVTVKTSTAYAILGLPVTVTVTSSEAGSLQLEQVRPDRMLGPGRCGSHASRAVGAARPIAAGQTITISVQSISLAYGGGDLFPPYGWDDPSYPAYQDLCYDRYSTFNQLRAAVSQPAPGYGYGSATTALQRIL